jgi:MFS family permease
MEADGTKAVGSGGPTQQKRSRARRGRGPFGYDRNVYIILLFTLGKGLQLSIAGLVTALYAYSLGFDKTFVGFLVGVPAIGSLVASIPTGLLADRWGRKPLILVGSLLNPLSLVALGLSTQAPPLIAASFLNGMLSDAYWVTSLPILIESTREDQRVGVLAANNFLMLGVGALGSLLAGQITVYVAGLLGVEALSSVPLRIGLMAAAVATFLPAIPLVWLRESHRSPGASAAVAAQAGVASIEQARPDSVIAQETGVVIPTASMPDSSAEAAAALDPPTRAGLIALFAKLLIPDVLYTTGSGATLALLSIYFTLNFHLDPGQLGAFLSIEGILGGATAFVAPRLVRRWGKLRTATTAQYLSVPVILGIGFAPIFPLAAGAEVARNGLRGLFDPTYAAFTMEQVSSRYRATLSGFYSVTWSVGFSAGSSASGWLYDHVSYGAAVTLSAVCIALAATLLRLWFRNKSAPVGQPARGERETTTAEA